MLIGNVFINGVKVKKDVSGIVISNGKITDIMHSAGLRAAKKEVSNNTHTPPKKHPDIN